ncbi:hypothetical protein [Rhizobium lusitanum]|uniref:hypothetical protein n=1 Tax=Rhizobium lusitanum TaxID=293958 RepID=UPI001957EEF3|nr:hypothetical protein [Rhizobium lusitanum]MBM7048366.1 hypothetical protein [Rhizobium lusitanum]
MRMLTYMATIEALEETRALIRVNPHLNGAPKFRQLFVFPEVKAWLDEVLPTLKALDPDDEGPRSQVWSLFRSFLLGHELDDEYDFRLMHPQNHDIYELKCPDVRFYGWFVDKGIFIAARVDSMERVHTFDLDGGYRGEAERARDLIDLDPPKYVAGASKEYVFSI